MSTYSTNIVISPFVFETIVSAFRHNHIPFKVERHGTMFDTPNAILIIRSSRDIFRNKCQTRLMKAIKSVKKQVYVYLHDAIDTGDVKNDNVLENYKGDMFDESDLNYIKIRYYAAYPRKENNNYLFIVGELQNHITLFNNIKYVISHTHVIYYLLYNKLLIRSIQIDRQTYNVACSLMSDDEIKQLHEYYEISISDKIDFDVERNCYIGGEHVSTATFFLRLKKQGLPGGHRRPCRIVDGFTKKCDECSSIVYVDKKHNCIMLLK